MRPRWPVRPAFRGPIAFLLCFACGLAVAVVLVRPGFELRGGGPPAAVPAAVARVVDGDTIALADGRLVRILGLDAPETAHPAMSGPQPFGREAADRLTGLVAGRQVLLERDRTEVDHFGRLLRHVWSEGALVSEILVEEGLAWANNMPPDDLHTERLRAAEARAREAGVGLWGLPRPTEIPAFSAP